MKPCLVCGEPVFYITHYCDWCRTWRDRNREEITQTIRAFEEKFKTGFSRTDDFIFPDEEVGPEIEEEMIMDEKDFVEE